MRRYAILVAATGLLAGRNYLPDVNSLLNSIQKHRLFARTDGMLDVYLLHYGFDPAWNYVKKAQAKFDFNLIGIELRPEMLPCPDGTKPIEIIKRARYFKLLDIGKQYDAICLLDADMFFVSPVFPSFFDLASGTRFMIAANERFKWSCGVNSYFESDGTSIFTAPTKLRSMICNVPIVFDLNRWVETIEYYCRICFSGYQYKGGERVGIGDLFAHNIAIQKTGRADDIIMLPMETMAQVHHVWRKPWTHLINDNGYWMTFSGDRVYMIHDTKRLSRPSFVADNMRDYRTEFAGWTDTEKSAVGIEKGLRAVQREWWELNFGQNTALNLYEFLPDNNDWNQLKELS